MCAVWSSFLIIQVEEREHSVDVDDRELGTVAVELELLWPAPQHHLVLQLDVRQRKFENLAALLSYQERVLRGRDG